MRRRAAEDYLVSAGRLAAVALAKAGVADGVIRVIFMGVEGGIVTHQVPRSARAN